VMKPHLCNPSLPVCLNALLCTSPNARILGWLRTDRVCGDAQGSHTGSALPQGPFAGTMAYANICI
jgi:hypothetical protein